MRTPKGPLRGPPRFARAAGAMINRDCEAAPGDGQFSRFSPANDAGQNGPRWGYLSRLRGRVGTFELKPPCTAVTTSMIAPSESIVAQLGSRVGRLGRPATAMAAVRVAQRPQQRCKPWCGPSTSRSVGVDHALSWRHSSPASGRCPHLIAAPLHRRRRKNHVMHSKPEWSSDTKSVQPSHGASRKTGSAVAGSDQTSGPSRRPTRGRLSRRHRTQAPAMHSASSYSPSAGMTVPRRRRGRSSHTGHP